MIWAAEPGSSPAEALNLLGCWAATLDDEITDAAHEKQPRHSRGNE
jgi:hypothetical protein